VKLFVQGHGNNKQQVSEYKVENFISTFLKTDGIGVINLHWLFFIVTTVHFQMKLYKNQRNAQVFNLFIYSGYGVSARALTTYPGDLNHCRNRTPSSEDGLKESPKHVR
jgi:hypothetical protein